MTQTDAGARRPFATTTSRNDPCPCGSGRKFKLCCAVAMPGVRQQAASRAPSKANVGPVFLTDAGRIARSAEQLRRDLQPCAGAAPAQARLATNPDQSRKPGAAEPYRLRGIRLIQTGEFSAAILALRHAVQLDPEHAAAHHALGVALLHSGQLAEAIANLRRAIALKSDVASAYSDLGIALDRQGSETEAIAAYRSAIAIAPKRAEIHRRLGEFYQARNKIEDATACYRRAAKSEADRTTSRLYQVKALTLEGNNTEAEQLLRKLIALDPTSGDAENGLADVLVGQGHFDEGVQHFQRSLELNPRLFRSWLGIARAKKFAEADRPEIERLAALLDKPGLDDEQRMILNFALGKMLDDVKDFRGAMRCFDLANGIRSRSVSFDRAAFAARVHRLASRFTPEFYAQASGFGTPDELPVLILGMPRSGTTLVEQIISRHPAVVAGDEMVFWTRFGARWETAEGADFTAQSAAALAQDYVGELRRAGPSASRVTDKLPFNFLRLGLIHLLLPRARIVHCRRNPLDTCLSIYSILFNDRMEFSATKADLAYYYRHYAQLMDHWRAVLPADRFLDVDYERLVANREAETRRLIAFIGLDWNDACLQPEHNDRRVKTASYWQARQPVYTTSVERWRRYEPWLGDLEGLRNETTDLVNRGHDAETGLPSATPRSGSG